MLSVKGPRFKSGPISLEEMGLLQEADVTLRFLQRLQNSLALHRGVKASYIEAEHFQRRGHRRNRVRTASSSLVGPCDRLRYKGVLVCRVKKP